MRFGIFQPYKLAVRLVLTGVWGFLGVAILAVGTTNPEPNHPFGLLLLGCGLASSGALAVLALLNSVFWERLIDPDAEARKARIHLRGLVVLGLAGAVMIAAAVVRLVRGYPG